MIEKYYNIHNIVKFKIVDRTTLSGKGNFYKEYENFETTEKMDALDFTIHFGKFTPSNQNCYITESKYYAKKDYFYCKSDSYKFGNWKFEITGFESDNLAIRYSSNLIGYLFASQFIIDFPIHFKLNEKGYSIVHGSCVSKDNRAFLFTARGGAGKTTIALNLLERGFSLLGDDLTILNINKGEVIGFLSPLNIFTYNLTSFVKEKLGIKNKVVLGLKDLLYKITGGYIKLFTQINAKNIFKEENIIDKSELDAIFFLIPKNEFRVDYMSKQELIDHLLINQKLETPFFYKYMLEYSYMFPESKLSTHWKQYKKNLETNLPDDIPICKIEVPRKYDSKVSEKILEVIKNECAEQSS